MAKTAHPVTSRGAADPTHSPKTGASATKRVLGLPPELQPFWDLAVLRDERVFALLPYRLEIR